MIKNQTKHGNSVAPAGIFSGGEGREARFRCLDTIVPIAAILLLFQK